jgi:DNA invertase Pin-like site-specific DNA recombinase
MKRAVFYIRTSKKEQHVENQLPALEQFAKLHDLQVVKIYAEQESAWLVGHQREWQRMTHDASCRHFDVVVVWALDRVCREGISAIFLKIRTLKQYGVTILSHQEPWLEGLGDMRDLFIALLSWVANFESKRRSERTKAGIAQKRLHGGGRRGSDKKKRKTRVIKRPLVFTPEPQTWQENL